MDIEKEVQNLIPELGHRISAVLPAEHRQALDDYIFLTLFDALGPYTAYGKAEAEKLVNKYHSTHSQSLSSR